MKSYAIILGSCDEDDRGAWHHQAELERQQFFIERNRSMDISELSTSKYLRKEDVNGEAVVTINRITKENVAVPGQPQKMRGVVHFLELEKGLVLNTTNREMLATFGRNTDGWCGNKVVLYVDEAVSFAGKIVGGLRLRPLNANRPQAASSKVAVAPARSAGTLSDLREDIPF